MWSYENTYAIVLENSAAAGSGGLAVVRTRTAVSLLGPLPASFDSELTQLFRVAINSIRSLQQVRSAPHRDRKTREQPEPGVQRQPFGPLDLQIAESPACRPNSS